MAHDRLCPRCGRPIPADARPGTCPACLLHAGLEPGSSGAAPLDASDGDSVTIGFASTSPGRVLESLARSIGSIPRVLLPDTANDDRGVAVIKPASPEMPLPSERGDRYQLFGEIARGGMGAVLKGRDVDLGRDLAVKVLLEGHRDKPDLLRRFVEEAQIGGQLQHPGIVPVYELGTFADSRPYFTMKLVKGRTLSQILKERPGPADELPRFLGVFEQVGQTVAYAHARGVIHRDLKPTNIMVGSFGEVQVMDWGLAKVLREGGVADEPPAPETPAPEVSVIQTVRSGSDADASQAGSALGTPAYMAPEQAGGEIERVDRRADVFGLGSILCEILTGQPAYTGRSQAELIRKAMRGDTGEALARLDGCGADGDLIALARDCLATEPEDRPRDAGVVAGRVSAYLAGVQQRLRAAEVARAQADARADEERKRRKMALALAASVVGLMALGGTGAAVYLQQRRDAAARVALAVREAHLLRDQAAADPMGNPAKWRAAEAAAHRAGELLGPLADAGSRREVQALRDEVAATAAAAERDAELLRSLVDIRSAEVDDPDGSVSDAAYAAAFRDADLDVDALGPEAAGARIRSKPAGVAPELAAALDDWARLRRMARPKDEAGWGRLIVAARAADPDATRGRMRDVWARLDRKAQRGPLLELAREADPRAWPAATLLLLAWALAGAGELDADVGLLRRAQAHHPGDVWLNYALARALEELHPPRTEEAIGYYTAARALRPETAHALGHALEGRGRGDEAAAVFADLVRRRPGDGRHWGCYGRLLGSRGDRAGAAAALEKAVAVLREAIRLKLDLVEAHTNLGLALRGQGKVSEAIAEYREAIRLKPDYAGAHTNLGSALADQGKLPEAIAAWREAIRLMPNYPGAHTNLGNVLADQGKLPEAIAELQEAIRLKPDLAEAHNNLGNALRGQGRAAEAIAAYREAIRLKPDLAGAHYNLGAMLCDVKRDFPGAEAAYREAIRLKPDLAGAHYSLGNALIGQGKAAEAIAAWREAIRLKPDYAEAHCNLGYTLKRQAQFPQALAEFRKGHELGSKRPGWPYPSAEWVSQAERMVALEARLPAVLRGDEKPAEAAEGLAFAEMAYQTKRFAASARLYAEALRADLERAEDLKSGQRYHAACAAALAGAGRGEDTPPDELERARWRKQAVAWLAADLASRKRQVETGPPQARAAADQALRHWKNDSELAGIRDPEALAKLPAEEQAACRKLWAGVDEILEKARAVGK